MKKHRHFFIHSPIWVVSNASRNITSMHTLSRMAADRLWMELIVPDAITISALSIALVSRQMENREVGFCQIAVWLSGFTDEKGLKEQNHLC